MGSSRLTSPKDTASVRRGLSAELGLYKKIAGQLRPYWLPITGVFLLGFTTLPLRLLTPLPIKIAVDSVVGSEPLPSFLLRFVPAAWPGSKTAILAFAALFLVATALLSQVQELVTSWFRTYVGEKIVVGFR